MKLKSLDAYSSDYIYLFNIPDTNPIPTCVQHIAKTIFLKTNIYNLVSPNVLDLLI